MKYTVKCPSISSAYVDKNNPNTNYSGNSLKIGSNNISFVKFDLSGLQSYTQKQIISGTLSMYNISSGSNVNIFDFYGSSTPINLELITYNTIPANIMLLSNGRIQDQYINYNNGNRVLTGNIAADFGEWFNGKYEYTSKFLNGINNGLIIFNGNFIPEDNDLITIQSSNYNSLYLTVNFQDYTDNDIYPSFPSSNNFVDPFSINYFEISMLNNPEFLSSVYINKVDLVLKNLTKSTQNTETITTKLLLNGIDSIQVPLPANVLEPNCNYEWKTVVYTDVGNITSTDESYFTTIDVTPSAPKIISPQSQYLDGEQPIILTWQHNISTGSTQYAYDIDYLQGGDWTNLVNHAVSSAQTYTIPANTLTAGNFQWRVRTYNTSNVPGPYTTSERNIVDVPPSSPTISSVTNVPRLSVSWQATGQEAFNLMILDSSNNTVVNSGNVYGVQKQYQIDTYLPDGNYTISLKIQNAQGEWSNLSTNNVTIRNSPQGAYEIQATPIRNGVAISFGPPLPDYGAYVGETILQTSGKYLTDKIGTTETTPDGNRYILRDGEPIAKIEGNTFIDYTSVGTHEYKLRVTFENGTYYDSPSVTAAPILPYATIAFLDNPGNLFVLMYQRDERPTTTKQISETLVSHNFLGRPLPVYDATGQKNIQWDFVYTILHNPKGVEQFFTKQKTVIVRDPKGEVAIGIIQSHNIIFRNHFRELSFSILGNGANEVVNYE